MKAETIAKALGGRKVGQGWTARSPAHDDRDPSLSIRDAGGKATSLSRLMKREHLKMTRMLGYSLVLRTAEAWQGFTLVAAIRLDVEERVALACAALRSLDPETAALTVEAAFASEGSGGMPDAPFTDFEDEAAFWADRAEPNELAAYAVAIFLSMPKPKRRAFLDFAERHVA